MWLFGMGERAVTSDCSGWGASPEPEALRWVSITSSSGLNIAPHCVTLGQGFSKDQSYNRLALCSVPFQFPGHHSLGLPY